MADSSSNTPNIGGSGSTGILSGSGGSNVTNPSSPDYECPAYREQHARWQRVEDVREGTDAMRRNRALYLPRFESEDAKDWDARVNMTFANTDYEQTLTDHVGLVFAEPPKLEDDVPEEMASLLEDVDGEGSHWHVFANAALESGLHLGHVAIWTDFPAIQPNYRPRLDEQQQANLRPYWTLVQAHEIISWRSERIGGVEALTQFVRRSHVTIDDGLYGTKPVCQYLVVSQAVTRDADGFAIGLGAIVWQLWREHVDATGVRSVVQVAADSIVGPKRIPLRVCYCGPKFGMLHTRPFLYGLATTAIEETQVRSDYAAVMHKTNIPVPVIKGLPPGATLDMSNGIGLPENGSAEYLEPKGTAIPATRQRLADIGLAIQQQGGVAASGDLAHARTMTATQAAQIARQRNARLSRAARALQDTLEGALADMAAFLKLPSGGSVLVNRDFAGSPVDPAFVTVCLQAYKEGAITRDEMRYALQHGELPEDADPETTAAILDAVDAAKADAEAQAEANRRAAAVDDATTGDPATDGSAATKEAA